MGDRPGVPGKGHRVGKRGCKYRIRGKGDRYGILSKGHRVGKKGFEHRIKEWGVGKGY